LQKGSPLSVPSPRLLCFKSSRYSCGLSTTIGAKLPSSPGFKNTPNTKPKIKQGKVSKGGGKNKAERQQQAAINLLNVANKLVDKIEESLPDLPKTDVWDLIERRILQGETIPHHEKMFSVFERYTEWINKGKRFVELGKQVCITTDENHLIVDYQIMKQQQDSSIIPTRVFGTWKIKSCLNRL